MNAMTLTVLLAMMCPPMLATAGESNLYVEYRWEPSGAGDVARKLTLGFVMDGQAKHQVCVADMTPAARKSPGAANMTLRIDVRDASGKLVSSSTHPNFNGPKRCYAAQLDKHGRPGEWTFEFFMNGQLATTSTVQVARTLAEAPFYRPSSVPYVLARPNYDTSFAADEWKGRLVWVMEVDEAGTVTNVEIETAEGIGERLKDRAMAAGYMSRFPPDPSRIGKPLKYRRELNFQPDR